MSRSIAEFQPEELPAPVCDYCGFEIKELDQDCVAVDEGVCYP